MCRHDAMLSEESRLDRGTYTTMRVIHMGIKNEDDDGGNCFEKIDGDWRHDDLVAPNSDLARTHKNTQ